MAAILQKWFVKIRPWMSFHRSLGSISSPAPPKLEIVKMSENVECWKAMSARESAPLVLMFTWLNAPTGLVQKYANLYHERGMDVLVVKGKTKHALWPETSYELAYELENCLQEIPSHKKFFVHAFSIGVFNYTVTQMNKRFGVQCFQSKKVLGQIHDSMVIGGMPYVAEGLAADITKYKLLQIPLEKLFLCIVHLIGKTEDAYNTYIKFNDEKLLPVPTLYFYSEDDSMCDVNTMEGHLASLKEKHGDNIWIKSWSKSAHVAHLRFHREEYLSAWNSFLDKLSL